ncbi:endoplasmic reticulum resident protein 27 isoform X2 [Taeniopygia guttata]|uniref:endoplasmic reticulum resident protein 27 isoform X2 n=1 Tax=Taeniopygia guttata TaxID=59729 RepID=UPI003BB865FD
MLVCVCVGGILFELLLVYTLPNPDLCSAGTASTTGKPILLNNIPDAEAFISGAEVAVIGFFQDPQSPEAEQFRLAAGQLPEVPFGLSSSAAVLSHYGAAENTVALFRTVDSDRRDLDMNNREVDAKDLTRFVRTNELRLVTEYNPVTAIGVMQSSLQFNLLLITDKMSPKHPERMRKFRAAAELYKGKILFILLDSNLKSNERVLSYFQLKKSQLPALAIFHTPDDEHEVLTVGDISTERVQDFCNRFLQRMPKDGFLSVPHMAAHGMAKMWGQLTQEEEILSEGYNWDSGLQEHEKGWQGRAKGCFERRGLAQGVMWPETGKDQ